tara:strand:- start:4554 stop:4964 length:411 start_codon:yes stop_codon:yes gene_type:complete
MSKSVRDHPVSGDEVAEVPAFVWDSYVEELPMTRTSSRGQIHYLTEGAALARHRRLSRIHHALESEFALGHHINTYERDHTLGYQETKADYAKAVELFERHGGTILHEFKAVTYAFPDGGPQFIFYSKDILERCLE